MYMRGRTALLFVIVAIVITSMITSAVIDDDAWLQNTFSSLSSTPDVADKEAEAGFDKLEETYEVLKKRYVENVDEQDLIDGAIRGMVGSLDDPYSSYMDQEEMEMFLSSMESSFEGIGAEVTMQDGRVTIISPLKGSPAEKAGLRPNDKILSVDDESLDGLSLNKAVSKIRGPKGSEVTIEVLRPGSSNAMDVTVKRDEIPLHTVESGMLTDDIGRLTVTNFGEETAEEFAEHLQMLEGQGMKGLIIDLRGNPGGYMNVVIDMASHVIPKGETILWTEDRKGKKQEVESKGEGQRPYPIIGLIDPGSASAAEILAGALQESGGYTLIGMNSFGKGTVQTMEEFDDSSRLKFTIAKWLTPGQNWIHEEGIQPDITVEYPEFYQATPPSQDQTWQKDDNAEEIRGAQLILKGLGFDPGRTDGYFSEETQDAIRAFQKDSDLKQTGEIGKDTALALQEKLLELVRDEDQDPQLQRAIDEMKKKIAQ